MSPPWSSSIDTAVQAHTQAALVGLAHQCAQAAQQWLSAATQSQADDVRALLRRRAEDYKAQAEVLRAHLQRLGGPPSGRPPADDGAWEGLARATLPDHADALLLEACERAEDQLLEHYAEALSQPLEPAARDALEDQRLEMKRQHDLLRAMRDRLRGLA